MNQTFDAVIIGSGFGGALTAHALVDAGWSVLLLERGDWVERGPAASRIENFVLHSPHFARDAAYLVAQDGRAANPAGALFCVGGASVFYGGVSFRLREHDFTPPGEIIGDSGAEWPIRYADLEPYYGIAERIIGVSGAESGDPTAPWRSTPYLTGPGPFSPLSERIAVAARSLGLHPFPLPMAIHHGGEEGRASCIRCGACDGFACPVSAKNDLATRVITPLLSRGLHLASGTAAVRLVEVGGRVAAVECVERSSGRRFTVRGKQVVLAAGALATPHLVLASGLERQNPGGHTVGRFLMRHVNSIIFGYLRERFPADGFGKDLAIHDFYEGDDVAGAPAGPLGGIQSLPTPPLGVVKAQVPPPLPWVAGLLLPRGAGLLTIAEDQPRRENGVTLDPRASDGAGLPTLRITHRYTARDQAADRALRGRARQILRAAGALFCYRRPIRTFSHALGTVRMGRDEKTSALDAGCRFRGIENLRVVDGSVFPTSAAVNPSLTIAANALRVAAALTGTRAAPVAASARMV
ncbi:MAG TPA: GMC family oxidoreductase [Gemmatimonadales bacterium]|jgi:choline dehydrogenase-like flavoprotein|nr:GMC family oxidoreductase [Gemmatimonadales bacterium]